MGVIFAEASEEAMDSDDEDFVTEKRKKKAERGKQEDFVQINFPSGHCLVHERWRNTPLARDIDKVTR